MFNIDNLTASNSPRVVDGHRHFYGAASVNAGIRFSNVRTNIGTSNYTVLIRFRDIAGIPLLSVGNYSPAIGLGPENYTEGQTRHQIVYHSANKTASSAFILPQTWCDLGYIRRGVNTNESEYFSDGQSRGLYTHNNAFSSTSAQIGINQFNPNHYHIMDCDFVYMWNRALSYGEIERFYRSPDRVLSTKSIISKYVGVAVSSSPVVSGAFKSGAAAVNSALSVELTVVASLKSGSATITATFLTTDTSSVSGAFVSSGVILNGGVSVDLTTHSDFKSSAVTITSSIIGAGSISGAFKSPPAKTLRLRILCLGQSNMCGYDTSLPRLAPVYNGSLMWKSTTNKWEKIAEPDATSTYPGTGSSMMPALLDKLYELTGYSCGSLNAASGGVGILNNYRAEPGWIDTTTPTAAWSQMVTKFNATGGAYEVVLFWGGEADMGGAQGYYPAVNKSDFKAGFLQFFENVKTLLSNPLVYLFCIKPNYNAGETTAEIRQAFDELAAETPRIVMFDDGSGYPLTDTVHITKASMVTIGVKGAEAIYDNYIAGIENKIVSRFKSDGWSGYGVGGQLNKHPTSPRGYGYAKRY